MDELKSYFLKVVRDNYANFSGRARRKEYWYFVLANFLISLAANILMFISDFLVFIPGLIALILFIPAIAVAVRRLHDTNRSGWYLLIGLIPIVNLYLIYLMFKEGDTGVNQYGPDPKGIENTDPFAGQRDDYNPFINR